MALTRKAIYMSSKWVYMEPQGWASSEKDWDDFSLLPVPSSTYAHSWALCTRGRLQRRATPVQCCRS